MLRHVAGVGRVPVPDHPARDVHRARDDQATRPDAASTRAAKEGSAGGLEDQAGDARAEGLQGNLPVERLKGHESFPASLAPDWTKLVS